MELTIAQESLSLIWNALQLPFAPGRSDGKRTAHLPVVESGWGMLIDIQDIVWETDDRADTLIRHHDAFQFLLKPAKLRFESVFCGPFGGKGTLIGHSAMSVAEIACYISEIERLGFTVDALPIAEAIRPTLLKRKQLTNNEVSVVRYKMERHKIESVVLSVESPRPSTSETVVTHSGYRVTALKDGDGNPVMARFDAPKSKAKSELSSWMYFELECNRRAFVTESVTE